MAMRNLLFYEFVEIEDLEGFRKKHQSFCESINIKGKILIAKEGINGCITGTLQNTQKYINHMKKDPRFSDMEYKEGLTSNHNFRKMIVRIRPEIITFKQNWSGEEAPYIEPKEFRELIESDEEFYILDTRNNYESKIGVFENAIAPDIDLFSEFPDYLEEIEHLKDKKIITYCTGGIRCEKAAVYMRKKGFKNVLQLHGGIINYGKEVGDKYWKGKCFVFDTRGAINVDPEKNSDPITQCEACNLPSDDYYNCSLATCDKRHILCEDCHERLEGCCSKKCKNIQVKLLA